MPYPVIPPELPPAIQISQVSESSNLGNPFHTRSTPSLPSSDLVSANSEAEPTAAVTVLSPLKNFKLGDANLIIQEIPVLNFETPTIDQANFLGSPLATSISDDSHFPGSSTINGVRASFLQPAGANSPELDALQPAFAETPWPHTIVQNTAPPNPLPTLTPTLETETNMETPESEGVDVEDLQSETESLQSEPTETPIDIEQPQITDTEAVSDLVNTLDLKADQQEFNPERQVIFAQGNVVMQVANGVLDADQIWINLVNRFAVAEGNVTLTRGQQILRGERVEYNFTQGQGIFFNASGEIFLTTLGSDISSPLPNDIAAQANLPISDRLSNQPVENVRSVGGLTFGTGGFSLGEAGSLPNLDPDAQGNVRRLRFEAAQIEFDAEGWQAEDVRITNDPFSPPELEVRADTAQFRSISPTQDELLASNARIVFDQGLTLPLLRRRVVFNRNNVDNDDLNPLTTSIGIDGEDRGGVFIENTFQVLSSEGASVSLTPQFFAERFIGEANSDPTDPSVYGLLADASVQLGPRTLLQGSASLTGLELDKLEDNARANLQAQQLIGDHTLTLEYSFRDRLFNGSLGFQDVQSSLGGVLVSPVIQLGNTGLSLSYQASAQYINADTDRPDLLEPIRDNNRINLGRFQASAALSRGFPLWRGEPLPPTATEGLRYTPNPVVPFLQLSAGVRGVATYYTNDDFQGTLTGSIGISGQIGHFSRPYLDYTSFNLSYTQALLIGTESPFTFDRAEDRQVLSGGIIQQIYGPIRLGFQTSLNLDSSEEINTDFILEYSRRTYGLLIRFNPTQSSGFVGLRINDFDWTGSSPAFSGSGIRRVEGGVVR